MPKRMRLLLSNVVAGVALAMMSAGATTAADNKPSADSAEPTFGSRTEKLDGSAALTIGHRLPTEWETKVGTDVRLAAPAGVAVSDNLLRGGTTPDQSSGAVWGNLTMPGLRPLGFDKTTIDARLDAGKDEGKLGATLSRSVPIDDNFSVTLQNSYSVKQSMAAGATLPPAANTSSATAASSSPIPAPAWATEEMVRLNVNPSGTTFSAGASSSTVDTQWHNKLSVEQTLVGPLKLTTSVEDAGTTAAKKSITAGFKRVW